MKVTNPNYCATVVKLPPKQKVEGLDNLVKVTVFGNDCLVSKDEDEYSLYAFFPAGTVISQDLLSELSLFRDVALNVEKEKKGFFEPNGRVKAIKFKGVISTGFLMPVGQLLWYIGDPRLEEQLKEGVEFNEINGVEICKKYQIKYNNPNEAKGDKTSRVANKLINLLVKNQFRFHEETPHLAKNLHKLHPDSHIVITDKWHGSSFIAAKVLIARKLTLWQKFINLLGGEIPDKKYGYVYSSGKPKSNLPKGIEGEWINDNKDYYISNIWKRAFDDIKASLEDGISIYGELVGFTEGGVYIQRRYDYGCEPKKYKLVVYRITYTKPDGNVIEFTWHQVKNYCRKYSLETVKELYHGVADDYFLFVPEASQSIEDWREDFSCHISKEIEGECKHCTNKVPMEGVVLRIEHGGKIEVYKYKSKAFQKHESDELDKGICDTEEQANNS